MCIHSVYCLCFSFTLQYVRSSKCHSTPGGWIIKYFPKSPLACFIAIQRLQESHSLHRLSQFHPGKIYICAKQEQCYIIWNTLNPLLSFEDCVIFPLYYIYYQCWLIMLCVLLKAITFLPLYCLGSLTKMASTKGPWSSPAIFFYRAKKHHTTGEIRSSVRSVQSHCDETCSLVSELMYLNLICFRHSNSRFSIWSFLCEGG